jgi:beta-lactamase superfamily II metal-dependent hydrolase
VGRREEIVAKHLVSTDRFKDQTSFKIGATFDFEGTNVRVLNAEDPVNELNNLNENSLALRISYGGFVYTHGGDTYAKQQQRMLTDFPDDIRAHVFNTNHHMHGSVSVPYLVKTDPFLFWISAEQAVFDRAAYTVDFVSAVKQLTAKKSRLIDSPVSVESGNLVVRVLDGDEWEYELYPEDEKVVSFP